MRETRRGAVFALAFAASMLGALFTLTAKSETNTFGTNSSSTVTDSNGRSLGTAQNVCRFSGDTQSCPPGATLMGFPQWAFLPGGNWIWIPNVVSTSDAAVNQVFSFETIFTTCGNAQTVTVSALADNSAEILVNDVVVLTISGDNPQNYKVPTVVNIPGDRIFPSALNTLTARVKNAANPGGCAGQYQCNPAGVVATITITDDLNPWPTCSGIGGTPYKVGQFESQPCPAGQEGANSRVCLCALRRGIWWPASNTCDEVSQPPVTCMSGANTPVPVGSNEPVACIAPKVGSAFHTCQSTGQWGPPDFNGCALPVAAAGGRCRDEHKNEIATCPSNLVCQSRRLPSDPPDFWCKIFGINCPVILWTADMFCDP